MTDVMQHFADDVNQTLDYAEATNFETEVAVSIVDDEDKFDVDLEPIFRAGLRYGLVPFDGRAGRHNTVVLHFKPILSEATAAD